MGVAEDFSLFKECYNIDKELIESISYRYKRITKQLNKDFRGLDSETSYSLYVGSYGRDTAAKGISDLDVAYTLPVELYRRYDAYLGNGQSALLQIVKDSVKNTYATSSVSGDGQVVVINFSDGIKFEILPVFINQNGSWTFADTNNGGSWRVCNPRVEIEAISVRSRETNRNLKYLCRMMRVWRVHNSVPISGALIDTLAYQFIANWEHRDKSFLYHDFMARDFLGFMSYQRRDQTYWLMPGSNQHVLSKGNFQAKAEIDYRISLGACELLKDSEGPERRRKWRTIFGPTFPV